MQAAQDEARSVQLRARRSGGVGVGAVEPTSGGDPRSLQPAPLECPPGQHPGEQQAAGGSWMERACIPDGPIVAFNPCQEGMDNALRSGLKRGVFWAGLTGVAVGSVAGALIMHLSMRKR